MKADKAHCYKQYIVTYVLLHSLSFRTFSQSTPTLASRRSPPQSIDIKDQYVDIDSFLTIKNGLLIVTIIA